MHLCHGFSMTMLKHFSKEDVRTICCIHAAKMQIQFTDAARSEKPPRNVPAGLQGHCQHT